LIKFKTTKIDGLMVLNTEEISDERGFFARVFCDQEIRKAGVDFKVCQTNLSQNDKRGTLRGLHYQAEPVPDPKIVCCVRGAVWDVVVDLRVKSCSYLNWAGFELNEVNKTALLIPAGCAHGFISINDDSLVLYHMGEFYVPDLSFGVRWDDPVFSIDWPIIPGVISERDSSYSDYIIQ